MEIHWLRSRYDISGHQFPITINASYENTPTFHTRRSTALILNGQRRQANRSKYRTSQVRTQYRVGRKYRSDARRSNRFMISRTTRRHVSSPEAESKSVLSSDTGSSFRSAGKRRRATSGAPRQVRTAVRKSIRHIARSLQV